MNSTIEPPKRYSNMIWRCLLLLFSMAGTTEMLSAQQGNSEAKEPKSAFIALSAGVNFSNFRDFATSPLTYTGRPFYVSVAHVELSDKRESDFTFAYSSGNYRNSYNEQFTVSKVNTFTLGYSELFEAKRFSGTPFNIKYGAQLNATLNHRMNESLFNNSEGIDLIANLMGTLKASLDVSRKAAETKRFLFFEYEANPRQRYLSYTLNVGLVNASYRNGFAYTSLAAPLNSDDFFEGYEFSIFSGMRLRSSLDYTVFLQNNNAIRFS